MEGCLAVDDEFGGHAVSALLEFHEVETGCDAFGVEVDGVVASLEAGFDGVEDFFAVDVDHAEANVTCNWQGVLKLGKTLGWVRHSLEEDVGSFRILDAHRWANGGNVGLHEEVVHGTVTVRCPLATDDLVGTAGDGSHCLGTECHVATALVPAYVEAARGDGRGAIELDARPNVFDDAGVRNEYGVEHGAWGAVVVVDHEAVGIHKEGILVDVSNKEVDGLDGSRVGRRGDVDTTAFAACTAARPNDHTIRNAAYGVAEVHGVVFALNCHDFYAGRVVGWVDVLTTGSVGGNVEGEVTAVCEGDGVREGDGRVVACWEATGDDGGAVEDTTCDDTVDGDVAGDRCVAYVFDVGGEGHAASVGASKVELTSVVSVSSPVWGSVWHLEGDGVGVVELHRVAVGRDGLVVDLEADVTCEVFDAGDHVGRAARGVVEVGGVHVLVHEGDGAVDAAEDELEGVVTHETAWGVDPPGYVCPLDDEGVDAVVPVPHFAGVAGASEVKVGHEGGNEVVARATCGRDCREAVGDVADVAETYPAVRAEFEGVVEGPVVLERPAHVDGSDGVVVGEAGDFNGTGSALDLFPRKRGSAGLIGVHPCITIHVRTTLQRKGIACADEGQKRNCKKYKSFSHSYL